MNLNLVRGLFLIAIALAFGLQSLRYSVGDFSRAGPGLFPAMVSSLLGLIGVIAVLRTFFAPRVRLSLHFQNIAIILVSLCGMAFISHFVNMSAGIVFMVFFSTLAAASYSWVRNLKICAGLLAMAFVLQKLLGLNLPLY
jgi:hypothetical protein